MGSDVFVSLPLVLKENAMLENSSGPAFGLPAGIDHSFLQG